MLFFIITIVCIQRIIELVIAKRNEQWMIKQGAYEVGAKHYPYMIALHTAFFLSILFEVSIFNRPISPIWLALLVLFIITQIARVWCLRSLGRFWNTKILILSGANVVKKGPYKYIRHPNYLIVGIEILLLPLMFQAYLTAIIFTCLNMAMLAVRIPAEEKALREATNYNDAFTKD
jgi:methyltransferase